MLVTCLSATEIFFSITSIFVDISCLMGEKRIGQAEGFYIFIVYPMVFYIVFLITLNRFVGCLYPITYRKRVSKKLAYVLVLCIPLFSVMFGSAVGLIAYHFDETIAFYWCLSTIVLFFVFCVHTYSKIYMQLAASAQRIARHLPGRQNLQLGSILWNYIFHQGHITSLMIVAAYTVFVFLPGLWWSVCNIWFSKWYLQASIMILITWKLNCICDAFIYIYTDRQVRKLFVKEFNEVRTLLPSWFCCRSSEVGPFDERFTPAVISRSSARQQANQ